MLEAEIRKELEAEIEAMNLKSIEELSENFIQGIKVSGLRLSREEKETVAFYYLNFGLDINNEEEVAELVLDYRKDAEDLKKEKALINQFEKTLGRLCGEDMTGYVHGSGYYTYETIMEGIDYMGSVDYAKYWFRTRF